MSDENYKGVFEPVRILLSADFRVYIYNVRSSKKSSTRLTPMSLYYSVGLIPCPVTSLGV